MAASTLCQWLPSRKLSKHLKYFHKSNYYIKKTVVLKFYTGNEAALSPVNPQWYNADHWFRLMEISIH